MFTIKYGPAGRQISVPGLKLDQVIAMAETLVAKGASGVCIIDPTGKSHELP
jgi:hypothetical protein